MYPTVPMRTTLTINIPMKKRRLRNGCMGKSHGLNEFNPWLISYEVFGANRQLADALACGAEDRIRHGRSDGRCTGLADTSRRIRAGYDVRFGRSHFVDVQRFVIVEVRLLSAASIDGDLAAECGAQSIDDSTFDLLHNDRRIHDLTAVYGADHTVNPEFSLLDRDL